MRVRAIPDARPVAKRIPAEPPAQAAARTPGLRGHPWLTLFTVALGVMMVALDGTIVAIANPAIQQDLGASCRRRAVDHQRLLARARGRPDHRGQAR